jgi:hypothetical protein
MRNLLALVGLLVVGFAVVGWYCGWYTVTINREPDGNLQIKTQVNTDKVSSDSSAFFEKVGQLVGERGEKGQQSQPPKTPAPSTPAKDNADGGWLLSPSRPGGGR